MKNPVILFLYLILASFQIQAKYSQFAHDHLKSDEQRVELKSGYVSSEIEYELNETVLSHFDTKYLRQELSLSRGFIYDLMAKLTISAGVAGKLEKFYDTSVNLPNQSIRFQGMQGFNFKLQKELPFSTEKTKYAVLVGSRGSLLSAKETNLAYGGFDFYTSFSFAHKKLNHYFKGNIQSEIVGRKKTKLFDGKKEITDAYSVLGTKIGYVYDTGKMGLAFSPHFYHTTDYNTRNPNLERITDKGFVWGAEFKAFFYISPDLTLYLSHMRESYIFNVVDTTIRGEVDYEIERNETFLGLIWDL